MSTILTYKSSDGNAVSSKIDNSFSTFSILKKTNMKENAFNMLYWKRVAKTQYKPLG